MSNRLNFNEIFCIKWNEEARFVIIFIDGYNSIVHYIHVQYIKPYSVPRHEREWLIIEHPFLFHKILRTITDTISS